MAVTAGLYGLGRIGAVFGFIRFPFKILLMLWVIEATPLGALAGWLMLKAGRLLSASFRRFSQSDRDEMQI